MVATTTPRIINRHIRDLVSRLKVRAQPEFLPVEPRLDSVPGECFRTVANQVQEKGGSLVHGWLIWEWPRILLEAEFHAVWRSPAGVLIDVAMKTENEKTVLFVVDESKTYDGERVDNIRHAVGKDPRIRTFIQNQNRLFKLFRAEHGNVTGEVALTGELAELMHNQQQLGNKLATTTAKKSQS